MHEQIHDWEHADSCDVCYQSLREEFHLVRHQRIPSGKRPYSCDVCRIIHAEA